MAEIRVSGNGTVGASPDAVDISLLVTGQMPQYADALDLLESRVKTLKAALVAAGIAPDRITTTSFGIGENREYEDHKEVLRGYSATHNLALQIDLNRPLLNALLTAAARTGTNPTVSLSFVTRQRDALRVQALQAAVAAATATAQVLATAAGSKLGALTAINYGVFQSGERSLSVAMECPAANFAYSIADDIAPAEVTVDQSVEMAWALVA